MGTLAITIFPGGRPSAPYRHAESHQFTRCIQAEGSWLSSDPPFAAEYAREQDDDHNQIHTEQGEQRNEHDRELLSSCLSRVIRNGWCRQFPAVERPAWPRFRNRGPRPSTLVVRNRLPRTSCRTVY